MSPDERPGAAARRLVRSTRAGRVHIALCVALGLAAAALVVAQAALLAHVITAAFLDGAPLGALWGSLAALAAVAVARGLTAAGFEASGRLGAARALSDLRRRLVRRLLVDRPGGVESARSGELATGAVQGVDALEPYFASYLPQAVLSALVPVALLAVVAPLDWQAAALLGVTVPLIPLFMVLIGKGAARAARSRWRTLGTLSGHFLDVVEGLATLRANGREGAQLKTIEHVGDRLRRETMRTLRIAFLSALVLELLASVGTALVAASVGIQLANGTLGLEAGLTVLLLAPELYLPLRQVGAQFHASADGAAAAERIFDVLDGAPAVAVPDNPRPAPDPRRGPVVLERVSFSHPGRPGNVLDDVSLELWPGELTVLAGPSGAGKSTLVDLLLRFAAPGSGQIECDGVDLGEVDAREWRRRIVWVPQRPALFSGSVADNIRLNDPQASAAAVRRAADRAGALELIESLPQGFETPLGEAGRRLSAGQAQRVALARAFLSSAPLVVLDEPTAHLDDGAAEHVHGSLRALSDRTVLVVAHRGSMAGADQVLELRDGRLAPPATAPVLEPAA